MDNFFSIISKHVSGWRWQRWSITDVLHDHESEKDKTIGLWIMYF